MLQIHKYEIVQILNSKSKYVSRMDSPIVCAVLPLDSWNYCSGEQALQPNINKILQSSLYS